MTFGNKIAYGLLRAATWTLSQLPLCFHRAAGRFVGWFVMTVVGYRRKVVEQNLLLCFPEKSEAERLDIEKRFYRHLGTVIGEAVWFGSCTNHRRLRRSRIVELEGAEVVNRYFDEGRSVMALSAHTGNFEITGGIAKYGEGKLKYVENHISSVYKKLSDPVWDKFMKINRTAAISDKAGYDGAVESRAALRYLLGHSDEQYLFMFITDQHPYAGTAREPVNFMGKPTYTMVGGAALAARRHLPVVYLSMRYRDDGKGYVMGFTPICDDASQMEPVQIMQRYFDLLEADLRQQPWNWLWSHRRWKTNNSR